VPGNAHMVQRFSRGEAGIEAVDVLRCTTRVIKDCKNNWKAAVACLEALKQCARPRPGGGTVSVLPNAQVFNAAISVCGNAGRAVQALELFEEMQRAGFSPEAFTYAAVIAACETAGLHDKVSELLRKGIDGGVFKPALGFDRGLNQLDLHESAVLTQAGSPADRDSVVAAPVAKGIFRHLLGRQAINRETVFVVGRHGSDALKNAIEDCMTEQAWTARHPLDERGAENLGRLTAAAALPMQPAVPGRMETRSLNPLAAEFLPAPPLRLMAPHRRAFAQMRWPWQPAEPDGTGSRPLNPRAAEFRPSSSTGHP